jgi:hypothetical protein
MEQAASIRVRLGNPKGVPAMTTELNEVEARQADRRKMNMVVLSWGVPAAFLLLAILAAWAWG